MIELFLLRPTTRVVHLAPENDWNERHPDTGTKYPHITGRVQAWATREKSSADIMEVWKEAGAWTCLSLFVISFIGASQRSHDSFVRFDCQGYSTSVKRLIFIRIAESNFRDYQSLFSQVPPWQDSI